MKVRYTGATYFPYLTGDKVYQVYNIERGWYRLMADLEDDYLFPPELFEVVEGGPEDLPEDKPENWGSLEKKRKELKRKGQAPK